MKILLTCALPLLACTLANAQWNSDPTVNNPVITAQDVPTAKTNLVGTTDLFGNAFFAWIELRGDDNDIFIQKMNADGTRAFDPVGVPVTNAVGNQSDLDIFPDGAGGVIVVWQDLRNGNNDIYAQRVDALGAVLWDPNGVAISNTASSETMPKLCVNSFSEFMVVWRDDRLFQGANNGIDLYCNLFSTVTGAKIWTADTCVVSEPGDQTNQVITFDRLDGGFITVWEDPSRGTGQEDIYAQRFTKTGLKLWGSGSPNNGLLASNSGAYANTKPSAIFDGAEGVGIAFQSSSRAPGSSTDTDIYFQRVLAVGTRQSADDIAIAVVPGSNQSDPQITYVGAGFAIGWHDMRNEAQGFGRDLYGRGITINGIPTLPANGLGIASQLAGDQPVVGFKVAPADNNSNTAIFVWDDARNGSANLNVYAQRVAANIVFPNVESVPLWPVNGSPVATRTGSNQTNVAISPLSGPAQNNVIVGWRDNRSTAPSNATQDIYASMLQLDGTLPVVLLEFNAVGKTDRIETSWKTSSEINVKEYIVEKSSDGKNFTAIGRVSAKGGTGANTYNFTDRKPLNGDNYYRLQAVDRDGTKDYSRIARVNMLRKLPAQVTVQPNPISGIGKVVFNNYDNGNYQVRVVDARGAVVQSKSVNIQSAMQQMDVNLSGLSNGRYWIQVLRNGTPVSNTAVQKQ